MTGFEVRWIRYALMIALALVAGVGMRTLRVSAQDYSVVYDVGSQKADPQAGEWPDWSFTTDVDIGASNWVAVNVVNTDCFIGRDDPRAGTANAGAIAWYAELHGSPGPLGYLIYGGTLSPVEGTQATGSVTVSAHPSADDFTTIRVDSRGLEDFARDNTFRVCIAGA